MVSDAAELGLMLEESPAAVLVVDLTTRRVVHVNDVAEQLAPGLRLPVALDAWSDAAVLRDPDGAELSDTDHPLSRVARAEPVAGRAVSAARRSAMGARREPLWMVAMSMSDAPMLGGHALVVLIPLRHSRVAALLDSDVEPEVVAAEVSEAVFGHELRDRALNSTALAVTVADAFDPEQPLVWVNPAFTAITGWTAAEAVGRNCRFLQGPETDAAGRRRLREAVEQGVSVSVTLLNYRKDGTEFWNQVDLSPVRDVDGRIAHYVGIQTDVTARVESEIETRRALDAEREARADAESTRRRMAFMVEAMNQLGAALDTATATRRLLSLVVPYLADWALLVPIGPDGAARTMPAAGRHRHSIQQGAVDELVAHLPDALGDGALVELLLGGRSVRLLDASDPADDRLTPFLDHPGSRDRIRALGARQTLLVAIRGRSEVHHVLVLARAAHRKAFSETEIETAMDLGRRAGTILENARLYEAQAHIAEVLQRSLLPELPRIDGVACTARYLANETSARIGGDFYEVLNFHEAGIGIAIGDVTGHDILAAAAMGHLKGLLRAAAFDNFAAPAAVLEQVDRLILGLGMPTVATAVFAHAVPHAGGWRLTWTGAGHPPLLIRHAGGRVEALPARLNDALLGIQESTRTEHAVQVAGGSTVIAYTDGLIERRGEVFDDGLARLIDAVACAPDDPSGLCDHILAALAHDTRDDDIALLTVVLG